MSQPFDAPDDDDLGGFGLPWLRYARLALVFTGVVYALLGLGFAPLYGWVFSQDPQLPAAFGWVLGVVLLVVAAANVLAAWGLGRRAKWAWFLGLILGAIYLPSGCLPIGALILYGLLRDDTRKACLG